MLECLKIFCPHKHINVTTTQESFQFKCFLTYSRCVKFPTHIFPYRNYHRQVPTFCLGTALHFLNILAAVWDFGYDSRQEVSGILQKTYCLYYSGLKLYSIRWLKTLANLLTVHINNMQVMISTFRFLVDTPCSYI